MCMQNKKSEKIIIDKVKLMTLQRLGCSERVIINKILYDKYESQGDDLIDTLFESLTDVRVYNNWGGNHNPLGKNQHKNNIVGQVDQAQVDGGQVVDKDKDKDIDIDIGKGKGKVSKFIKPTIDDIEQYCSERNNGVDACKFYDFYESKGWKVGNASMKDWKACVRTWESRNHKPIEKPDAVELYLQIDNQKREEQQRLASAAEKAMELARQKAMSKFGG